MSEHNLDENLINNIDSKYYSVSQLNKVHNNNTFKIFHTNLNGLEHKFQLLDTLISFYSCIDFEIVNISETSQIEGN